MDITFLHLREIFSWRVFTVWSYIGSMAPRQADSWNNDLPVSAPLVFINKEKREHLLLMCVPIFAAPNKAFRFCISGCAPDHQGVCVFGSLWGQVWHLISFTSHIVLWVSTPFFVFNFFILCFLLNMEFGILNHLQFHKKKIIYLKKFSAILGKGTVEEVGLSFRWPLLSTVACSDVG